MNRTCRSHLLWLQILHVCGVSHGCRPQMYLPRKNARRQPYMENTRLADMQRPYRSPRISWDVGDYMNIYQKFRPSCKTTGKDVKFEFGEEQLIAMETLK